MKVPASSRLLAVLAIAIVISGLTFAYAQDEKKKGAQNPYLKGTEGYYKSHAG